MKQVESFIRDQTGLILGENHRSTVEAAVERAMGQAGVSDIELYTKLLEQKKTVLHDLIDEITVRETYFFRDRKDFDLIRTAVIPQREAEGNPGPIKIWSAGCATGEEPYSIAILLDEMGMASRTEILATDISQSALARARRGQFREWSMRGNDEKFIDTYFRQRNENYSIEERFRHRVAFQYLNLAQDFYVGEVDLIVCKNVMIYFDPMTIAKVGARFFDALAPGGWLITSASDPDLRGSAPFQVVTTPSGFCYRRGGKTS